MLYRKKSFVQSFKERSKILFQYTPPSQSQVQKYNYISTINCMVKWLIFFAFVIYAIFFVILTIFLFTSLRKKKYRQSYYCSGCKPAFSLVFLLLKPFCTNFLSKFLLLLDSVTTLSLALLALFLGPLGFFLPTSPPLVLPA